METRFHAPVPLTAPMAPARPLRAPGAGLVPAVSRALTLLERLARAHAPMTLARLASELALPKSSVHGLCSTLVSYGYLRRQPDGAYLIGPRVMGLAEAFMSSTDVAREFNALWSDAGSAPEETVVLSVLTGGDALYIGVRNSARPLGVAFSVGVRLPAYLSGSGKAMLSMLPSDEVRRLYAGGLQTRLTKKGPRDVEALLRELAAARRRGYSVDEEAVREGVCGFGAPVYQAGGGVVAGIAVCVNKALLAGGREQRYSEMALGAARALSQRLGAEPPAAQAAPSLRTRSRKGSA
jgi:DNA-binding IclR family transcriptional regulator